MSEEAANRRAALNFVGRLYSARGFGDPHRREQATEAYEWALSLLEPELTESGHAPGGWVSPLKPDPTLTPFWSLRPTPPGPLPGPPDYRVRPMLKAPVELKKVAEALAEGRADFLNQRHQGIVPEPGDGGTTPPIFRFFKLTLPDRVQLWREDTRNTELLRWSFWQEDEQRWFSTPAFDIAIPEIRGSQDGKWSRIYTAELAERGAQVETPGDFEEQD